MNSIEKNIYLELLRAALWERKVDISVFHDEWRWKVLLSTFMKNDLLGVVANVIILLPENVKPSMQEMALVYNYLGSQIQSHRELNLRLAEVMPKLKEAGCHPVLLKGQGLSGLYPKTCVRACGDLDIFVGEEKIEVAKRVVHAMATPKEIEDAGGDSLCHYQIVINGIIYEIHRAVGKAGNERYSKAFERIANQYLDSGMREKVSLAISGDEYTEIEVPALDFNIWYIFNHLVVHLCDAGVGMRQFCDWMMVVRKFGNKGTDSLIALERSLKQIGLLRAWKILGGILVYQLGLPAEQFPLFDERMAKKSQGFIVDDILEGERFCFAPLEELRGESRKGLRHFLYNLRFYYYISRARYVVSPFAPYITCAKFLVRGLWNAIRNKS